jgi:S-methylmethionine-dependent homocysteine/selenocysteine methylase
VSPADLAAASQGPVVLDGAIGTELLRLGIALPPPLWSAVAIERAPDVLMALHGAYAAAGATVHTANTFRATAWAFRNAGLPDRSRDLSAAAVALARAAIPAGHRVAGSIAPLEDCYSPERSPPPDAARRGHRENAEALARAGVDLLLCETFPHFGEAHIAAEEAVRTGLPVWLSLTAGPRGDLLALSKLRTFARTIRDLGVGVVLVNCLRRARALRAGQELSAAGVPWGAYANVGAPDPVRGWRASGSEGPSAYGRWARTLWQEGAAVVGGCCGTGPGHIAAVARSLIEAGGAPSPPDGRDVPTP